eukprot:21968-Eustigmatos_ZCMA.PRE.1
MGWETVGYNATIALNRVVPVACARAPNVSGKESLKSRVDVINPKTGTDKPSHRVYDDATTAIRAYLSKLCDVDTDLARHELSK